MLIKNDNFIIEFKYMNLKLDELKANLKAKKVNLTKYNRYKIKIWGIIQF